LGGWFQPGLHILLGAPGAGKSAFALQAAADCRAPALYVTAEMTPVELLRRLTARQTNTFLGRLKSGELTPADVERLAVQTCGRFPLFYTSDSLSKLVAPSDISSAIEAIQKAHGAAPLVVIDSLQAWARAVSAGLRVGEYEALEAALGALASVASSSRAAVLVVSHRNRAGNRAGDGGGLFAAKGSGSVEYLAETVLGFERPDDARPDAAGEVRVELRTLKNRHGYAGGSVELLFCGRLQSFREI
jgi:replicative DNA helicase